MPFRNAVPVVALSVFFWSSAPVHAQDPAEPPAKTEEEESTNLFGWALATNERLKISGLFIAGWSHDGAQAQLGFEKQGRVGQATISFAGRLTDRIHYLVSFNPINEVSAKPACGEADFFFPNDPSFYTAGPLV